MKPFVITLLVLIYFTSCTVKKEERNKITDKVFHIYEENWITNDLHGKNIYYYENGNIDIELNYNQGEINGEYLSYYRNKNLEFKVEYKDGVLLNVIEYYNEEGEELDFGTFNNGNGHLKKYYDDGTLRKEGDMLNGLMDGAWKFYTRGKYFQERLFKEGVAQDIRNNKRVSRVF